MITCYCLKEHQDTYITSDMLIRIGYKCNSDVFNRVKVFYEYITVNGTNIVVITCISITMIVYR